MLHIEIPDVEYFDENTNTFFTNKGCAVCMEHSLLSISKWESKWHIPFISDSPKTVEQTLDYYRCMTITQNVSPSVYKNINEQLNQKIQKYMSDSMTATWFNNSLNSIDDSKDTGSAITSEIIYYWMISLGIPFECQKWHINRLLTLIRVVSTKNAPAKKMSKNEVLEMQMRINRERRAKLNSNG